MARIAATLVSVLLMGSAYAEAPKMDSRQEAAVEHHIQELRGQLQITAAEEAQWTAVATAMRDSAVQTDRAIDKRKALGERANAVDSLSAYGEIAQAHADGVKQLAVTFAALYALMPAEQQAVADTVFAHRPHKGKKAA